jgi:hypothetical protein
MVGAKGEEKDDRDWNADQPQHDGPHYKTPTFPLARMNRLWNGSMTGEPRLPVKYSPPS